MGRRLGVGQLSACVGQPTLLEGGAAGYVDEQQCAIGYAAELLQLIEANNTVLKSLLRKILDDCPVPRHDQQVRPARLQARRR
eukprot:1857267-Alexandrium_andersonii.AAC.1